MPDILAVAVRLSKVNVTKVLVKILNKKSTVKFITSLNTDVQLFSYGEDSRGVQLASIGDGYALSTIRIKKKKRQPTNRVTLKDTGDFYKTFDVIVKANANFSITADTMKGSEDLEDRWGSDLTGLQPENEDLVMEYLEEQFYNEIFRGL